VGLQVCGEQYAKIMKSLKFSLVIIVTTALLGCGRAPRSDLGGRQGGLTEVNESKTSFSEVRGASDMQRLPLTWPYHLVTTGEDWYLDTVKSLSDDFTQLGIASVSRVLITDHSQAIEFFREPKAGGSCYGIIDESGILKLYFAGEKFNEEVERKKIPWSNAQSPDEAWKLYWKSRPRAAE
jgi:hypothetical protein